MATYSNFIVGSTTGHAAMKRMPYVLEAVADFSVRNVAAGDVLQMINIPAETVVLAAGAEVLTVANGTTPTASVGWGGDDDEWVATQATDALGYLTRVGNGTAGAVAVSFPTADTLDLTNVAGTNTAGVIRVWALMLDVSGVRETSTAAV